MRLIPFLSGIITLLASNTLLAGDSLKDIPNYHQHSDFFSSAGQPSAEQLASAAEAGFERVIYLAFSDNQTAIEAEDRLVKQLGMDYTHIPVDFEQPTLQDFEDFSAILNRNKKERTLVHCQISLRASTFSFLYRVIYAGVPMAEAKAALDAVWVPDQTWYQFTINVLKQHGLSHDCNDCDWAENEMTAQ